MRTDGHRPGSVRAFLGRVASWLLGGVSPSSVRGPGFWLVTAALGLLLPAPVAVAVVAARLRRTGAGPPAGPRGG